MMQILHSTSEQQVRIYDLLRDLSDLSARRVIACVFLLCGSSRACGHSFPVLATDCLAPCLLLLFSVFFARVPLPVGGIDDMGSQQSGSVELAAAKSKLLTKVGGSLREILFPVYCRCAPPAHAPNWMGASNECVHSVFFSRLHRPIPSSRVLGFISVGVVSHTMAFLRAR